MRKTKSKVKIMKQCVIFCAAGFDGLLRPIDPDDYIIAADGGLKHTEALGITAHAILGDFDSLGYTPESGQVFPVEKDDTDAMLAVRHGLARGCKEYLIYGGLDGKRLDHTVANFQTLQYLADRDCRGWLIGKDYIVTVLKDGTLRFPKEAEGILSVFCMGADAGGVTLEGLQYPLQDGTLTAGFPLGVSNHFVGREAAVTVKDGSLLLMWDRENGLPAASRR